MEEMILYLTLALLLLGGVVLFFFVIYRYKLNRHIQEQKELEAKNIQTLLQTKVEIRDQTLKDVSLEIHDNVAQILSLAKLHLSSTQISDPDVVSVRVGLAKELVSRAIQDLRNLSKVFSSDEHSEFNFVQAVEQQVEQIRKAGLHEIQISLSPESGDIGYHNAIILFRIIQEALQNVLKHSAATIIQVSIDFSRTELVVCIKDNGIGFDVGDVRRGQGLENIRKRSQLIGASCDIVSVSGEGTWVSITMPLNKVAV